LIEGDGLRALAEAGGSAEPLGDWMIAAACRQARRWRDGGSAAPARVAVPLSSRRPLAWSGLAERLAAHLAAAGLGPEQMEIEIEEPLLLAELADGGEALRAVRARGVRLAVTAFGAGPMSLRLLRDAPLTTVKLARPLLQGTPSDRRRTELVGNLIRLARQLDLRVVAEGVESHAQLRLLRAQGCDAVQSPAGSPPPTDACAEWLRQVPPGPSVGHLPPKQIP
jgi:EAL domain-containing protein (putative c-di-GMP-specific phosphodiesterase class I)